MRAGKVVFLWLGLVTAATLAVAGGGDSMPQVLYSTRPEIEYPVWVAAEAALDPDGTVNRALFPEWAAKDIETNFGVEPVDGCIPIGAAYEQFGIAPPARDTVRAAARNVAFALHGRVTGKSYGFHTGIPGQLLEIEPIELLKGGPENLAVYYAFFPVGNVPLGDRIYCKSDHRFPYTPEIGDELLVTDPWRARKDDRFIETWGPEGLIVIESDGSVHLPKHMKLGEDEEAAEGDAADKATSEEGVRLGREHLLDAFKNATGAAGEDK
jgi:hypothetical protein